MVQEANGAREATAYFGRRIEGNKRLAQVLQNLQRQKEEEEITFNLQNVNPWVYGGPMPPSHYVCGSLDCFQSLMTASHLLGAGTK